MGFIQGSSDPNGTTMAYYASTAIAGIAGSLMMSSGIPLIAVGKRTPETPTLTAGVGSLGLRF